MRGSTFKRCGCRDERGRLLGSRCAQLRSSRHGSWFFALDLGVDAAGRRRLMRRGGFPTEQAARAALADAERRYDAGLLSTDRITVAQYLRDWLTGRASLRPSTRRAYLGHIERHLIPRIGTIEVRNLRAVHIERMLAEIRSGEQPVGPATARRTFATLRAALNKAVREGVIGNNPCRHVELESEVEHRSRPQPWRPQEVRRFLDQMSGDRMYALYLVVVTCGLRRGEVIGLRWEDVDLDAGLLLVRHTVLQLGGRVVDGTPKTKRSVRVVPIDEVTVVALRHHRHQQESEEASADGGWRNDNGRVFTRGDGSQLVPEHVSRHFRRDAQRAGVPVIRFHDLRHTTASLALAAGVPMRVVSERLGHSTIAITSDLYTTVYDEVGRQAAERIGQLIAGATDSDDADRR